MTYRNIKKSQSKNRLDRQTWASDTVSVVSVDVSGSGTLITDEITFGAVFEGAPFFRYGVEVKEISTPLVDGDFPFVTAGVSEWVTNVNDEDDQFATKFYLGAFVYVNVVSFTSYDLRFRFSFEGIAMKNAEFFQGSS